MKDVTPLYMKFWRLFDEFAGEESELIRAGAVSLVGDPERMNRGVKIGFGSRARFELLINVHHYATPKGTGAGMPPNSIAIGLRIDKAIAGREPDEVVAILREEQQSIHAEVGSPLEWPDPTPAKPQTRQVILLANRGSDPANESNWPVQRWWLLEKLERFHAAFVPRLEALGDG